MRILHICHVFPPEHAPAGVNAEESAEDFAKMGHDVAVITGWPNHPGGVLYRGWRRRLVSAERAEAGYTLIRCWHSIHPRKKLAWRLWCYFTFAVSSFLCGLFCPRPDVILCESTPLFGPLLTLLLAGIKRAPLVYKVNDLHPESALNAGLIRKGPFFHLARSVDTWVCSRAALVVTLTESMRRSLLARQLNPERVLISRQWVDGEKIKLADRDNPWRKRQGVPTDKFVALHAGTIGYISGARVIVEAARQLRDRKDILFLFVGDGPLKQACEDLANAWGLNNVRFLPFQDASVLSEVQAAGDVGIVTLKEKCGESSLPSKMHGYTAAGRPVVASVSESCATAELIRAGGFGLVTPPEDPGALAEAIRSLADAPNRAAALGKRARSSFMAMFERKAQTRNLEGLLRQCARGAGASPGGCDRLSKAA